MRRHIVLNVVLALIWCALQEKLNVTEFVIGSVFGYGIIFMLKRVLEDEKEKISPSQGVSFVLFWRVFCYFFVFIKEMIKANIDVVKIVLSPKLKMTPGIIAYKMDVKTDAGITLLANSITLTPGTLSVDISEDRKTLYIHALHIEDAAELQQSIRDSLEKHTKDILG
ncbi:MAG: Na+/H+ antiporter subunit E [Nitrospirota bacterium]|nr:Na+/H+ antiporter subunit E [Nitrospirota bacterium]